MGTYSFANFKSYLQMRLGERADLASPTDHLGRYINMAYRRLTTSDKMWETKRFFYFPELEVDTSTLTTDGLQYIYTPSDCLVIREIYDTTDDVQLDWMSWPGYIGKTDRFDTTAESEPAFWHRRGNKIYLYPTPDASTTSLTLYYKKRVTNLDGSTYNTTLVGTEWDDVILEMATHIAWSELNMPDRAEYAKKNTKEMIAELIGVYDSEEKARRETLQPDPAWNQRGMSQ